MTKVKDQAYLDLMINPIRVCANYKPKLGHSTKEGYTFEKFQYLYKTDPFYHWIGLDNPLMYAAHKASGGMTSIYRQIGIGCEMLFRQILKDTLDLSDEDVKWSYKIPKQGGKTQTLSLDGRITLEQLKDAKAKRRITQWIEDCAKSLDIAPQVIKSIRGVVFEVRQGYKSKDSKRQNADITNATTAYTKGYLPCVAVLSTQIDEGISIRYRNEKWVLLTGIPGESSPLISIYTSMRDIVGYDLASFFERNQGIIKAEVDRVLQSLLSTQ